MEKENKKTTFIDLFAGCGGRGVKDSELKNILSSLVLMKYIEEDELIYRIRLN